MRQFNSNLTGVIGRKRFDNLDGQIEGALHCSGDGRLDDRNRGRADGVAERLLAPGHAGKAADGGSLEEVTTGNLVHRCGVVPSLCYLFASRLDPAVE